MLKILIFLSISFSSFAAERAVIEPVPEGYGNEDSYHILKLETRINDLTAQLEDLQSQLKELDTVQAQILAKVNSLLPQEGSEIEQAHLDDNMEEFNYAYKMLISGEYDRAKRAFELFIQKYPKDPKIGEIYFWLGEVAYKSTDYKEASRNYLIAYRDYQDNKRRNDALFKLSISLGFLGKKSEACGGFDLLINDATAVSPSLRQKASDEYASVGCANQ